MVTSVGTYVGLPTKAITSMCGSIHEDNIGARLLEQTLLPQFTPKSNYYATNSVWFCEDILKFGVKLLKIDTKK